MSIESDRIAASFEASYPKIGKIVLLSSSQFWMVAVDDSNRVWHSLICSASERTDTGYPFHPWKLAVKL